MRFLIMVVNIYIEKPEGSALDTKHFKPTNTPLSPLLKDFTAFFKRAGIIAGK